MEKNKRKKRNVIVYESEKGEIKLNVDLYNQTLWARQKDIVDIFGVDQSVVSRHINNIFKDGEVDKKSNMQKMHIANSDKPVRFYSLDILLAVGYRTNSSKAILFRKWATRTLKKYISEGYAVNKSLIKKNYKLFQNAVDDIKKLIPANSQIEAVGILEIIRSFSSTWLSLDAYDRSTLPDRGKTVKEIDITAEELEDDIQKLKSQLVKNKTASELFAKERSQGGLENIVRNIFQGFGGNDLYPTLEEKAAYLLYFVIKNHPFIDGNKRSGAFSFLWFLKKANLLNTLKMSPEVLTTLTILVAESKMEDKERMIKIVLMLLTK